VSPRTRRVRPPTDFTAWLRQQCERDDPIGDLARDVGADPAVRDRHLSFIGLRRYLWGRRLGPEVLRACAAAGVEWHRVGRYEGDDVTPRRT
jgi:hypothetical protein